MNAIKNITERDNLYIKNGSSYARKPKRINYISYNIFKK